MGNNPTNGGSQQQQQQTATAVPQAVPYTTYSREKPQDPTSAASSATLQDQQQRRRSASGAGVDGIVTVLSGGEAPSGSVTGAEDAELAALRALPVFAPIIRGSLAGNLLGRVKSEQARGVDATAALLLCRDLQEHLKLCGMEAAAVQDGLTLRIRDAERLAEHVAALLLAHTAEVRTLTERMGDAEGLAHATNAVRQRVAFADAALRRLDVALRAAETELEVTGPAMLRIPPEHAELSQ